MEEQKTKEKRKIVTNDLTDSCQACVLYSQENKPFKRTFVKKARILHLR